MRPKKQTQDKILDFYNPKQHEIQPIKPLTNAQERYIKSIKANTLTFGIGPAGTGKSYVAAALAADLLRENKLDTLILTRPAVEAGEKLGFLPGELTAKYEVYLEPVIDILNERLGKTLTQYYIKHGRIVGKPLAFMRGCSFKHCFVILDEAQNLTPSQMLMFLTRIGVGCKVVVDGDPKQSDLNKTSGLVDAMERLDGHLNDCRFVYFDNTDIVRSGIVQEILELYNQ